MLHHALKRPFIQIWYTRVESICEGSKNLHERATLPKIKKKEEILYIFLQNLFHPPLPAYQMGSVPTSAAPVLGHFLGPW